MKAMLTDLKPCFMKRPRSSGPWIPGRTDASPSASASKLGIVVVIVLVIATTARSLANN